jgi:hypothetical protein
VTTPFDRVRTRVPTVDPTGPISHDNEGKRALFSSMAPDGDVPSMGSVTVECSRCADVTTLSPVAALRTALPSFLLSIGVGRGDRESTVGLSRRRYGAFLRCPACGRGSWTRLTVRL